MAHEKDDNDAFGRCLAGFLAAVEVRFARPTDKLGDVIALQLPPRVHLASRRRPSPGTAPTRENLLVFYFATEAKMFEVVEGFGDAGHEPVELDNLWWRENGALAFSDPDGWRVVLMPKPVPLLG